MSIRTKAIITILLFSLLPLSAIGIIAYKNGEEAIKSNLGSGFQNLAYELADKVDRSLHEIYRDVSTWAGLDLMQEIISGDIDSKISSFLSNVKKDYGSFSAIRALNAQGEVVASSDPATVGQNFAHADFHKDPKAGKVYMEDAHPDGQTKEWVITFAFPVYAKFEKGKIIGSLCADWKASELFGLMPFYGTGDNSKEKILAALIRKDGLIISAPTPQKEMIFKYNIIEEGAKPLSLALQKPDGYLVGHIWQDKKYLIGYARSRGFREFRGFGWTALYAQDADSAFVPLKRLKDIMAGVGALVLLATIAVSFIVTHRLAQALRKVSLAAARVAGGDFEAKVDYASGDEIGSLVESFNKMTMDLKKQREQLVEKEALCESEAKYRTLVEQIPAITYIAALDKESTLLYISPQVSRILGFTPEEYKADPDIWRKHLHPEEHDRVLAESIIAHVGERPFIAEYRIISKDKKVVWVRNEAFIVRDDAGKPLFRQGVMYDITERKTAEEALLRIHEDLEKMVHERTEELRTANDALQKGIEELRRSEKERERLNLKLEKSNKRFERLSLLDSRTGLYNYRYLTRYLEQELYRSKRQNQPLSLIMMDIDYFKSLNDAYGHTFGDIVLKQFGSLLKQKVRTYDVVARFGGEEFVIVTPDTDTQNALSFARRLHEAIKNHTFGDKRNSVRLKTSMGVASYPEKQIKHGMELIGVADKILGKAKGDGGDRVYSSADLSVAGVTGILEESDTINVVQGNITKIAERANHSVKEALFAMAKEVELKDNYTAETIDSTVRAAEETGRALGMPENHVELVRQAAILRDLGKVGIPEAILNKKEKLSREEFDKMKNHPQIAVTILNTTKIFSDVIPLILHHHEKWNGKGYPYSLKGQEIPLGSRIIAVADAYGALVSNRPYRIAYPFKQAIAILKEQSNISFDPGVVDQFVRLALSANHFRK